MSYGFHGNNFRKTKFCCQPCNAWVLHFWEFRQNSVCRCWAIKQKKPISVLYWHLEDLPCLAPSGVHFCNTLPVFGSFQSLLNYSRKSITPRKLCSEHELYLSFRRTYYQNFRTITISCWDIGHWKNKEWVAVSIATTSGVRIFAASFVMPERVISESFSLVVIVVLALKMKKVKLVLMRNFAGGLFSYKQK